MDNFSKNIEAALQNNDQATAAKLAKEHLENLDNVPLTIAVTGESGSGKSSLVNALRGLNNSDEGAAPTGVVETTVELNEYLHPDHPNVKIWDLPGIGTKRFRADEYLKKVGFEKFDFFIIISDTRFRENDAKLAKEIQKMKKKFYFVRSKIDHNIQDEKRSKKEFNEEETLKRIRDDCIKGLEELGIESPKVFLVSSFDLKLYDFDALWKILEKELPEHKREALLLALPNIKSGRHQQEERETKMDNFSKNIEAALQNNDQATAAKLAKEHLENLDNVPLTIAVTGESGSGKSSLVNALRGLNNSDEGAAPTGVVETTVELNEYLHPDHPNVKIWDLPGIGTKRFRADEYLKKVEFDKFDFFIIVSDTRFRENDAKLAEEIQKMKKKFYFVRSKIDHNIRDEKRSKKEFNEEETLKRIRDNCIKGLEELGIESPKVFLVSSFDLKLYDFDALWKILEKKLPEHKRHALLLALPNISLDVINKKKEVLKAKIKWLALASAAGAAVPIPGSSIVVDLVIIMKFVIECQKSLGLRAESLQSLSEATGVPMEELKKEIKSPLTGVKITTELLMGVLRGYITVAGAVALEEGSRFVPIVGIPVAMGLSGFSTYLALKYLLKTLGEDAQSVFIKAMSSSV